MYTQFFGLRDKPFSLSPDPRFLYLSDSHREALAHLLYGIEQGEGFIAITGEVGTGKTTLCRTLLDRIEPGTEVAFIFNPQLNGIELLQSIAAELGLETEDLTRRELTEQLNRFLLAKKREGRRVLLIIDEAQVLERDALEQVRLLSNLETNTSKLIQIILIGQPELDTLLEAPDLRQLRQRITVRWRLGALTANETREYVRHRLRIAAGEARDLFTEGALREIHRHSRGVPRLINLLCDRSLLAGYAAGMRQISLGLVTKVEGELKVGGRHEPILPDGETRRRRSRAGFWQRWFPAIATLVAAILAALLVVISLAPGWLGLGEAKLNSALVLSEVSKETPPVNAPPPSLEVTRPETATKFVLAEELVHGSTSVWAAEALDRILMAWGGGAIQARGLSPSQVRGMLQADGFEILELPAVTVDELLAIDRPAILFMDAPDGTLRPMALLAISHDRARIAGMSSGPREVPLVEVTRFWNGDAWVPWRDPAELPHLLRQGAKGPDVVWLQQALNELGYGAGVQQGTFDDRTVQAVRAFQRSVGLEDDGHVGPLTKLRLYERLERYDPMPRLRTPS